MNRRTGIETEYGLAPLAPPDGGKTGESTCGALIELARRVLRYLPGVHGTGLFLENGGRLYEDGGHHPEYCTPEVDHPDDVVRYVRAGDATFRDLTEALRATRGWPDVALFKCNVDYMNPGTSWGLHESIEHTADPAVLPADLLPFLASRVTLAGAGGLDPRSAGLRFSLSPRTMVLQTDVSEDSMHLRALFHERDESHAGPGIHRLHLICGESLCSDLGTWLRAASTMMVVALAEAGLAPGRRVRLADPLRAARAFAMDPDLGCAVPLLDGRRRVTALEVQRHYLEAAERFVDHERMPPWAPRACVEWRSMLDRLERGPDAVARTLDWAIKRALFRDHAADRGFGPEAIEHWNPVLAALSSSMTAETGITRLQAELVLGPASAAWEEIERWTPHLAEHGLDWEQLRPLLELRDELCEIDLLFSQVSPRGLFDDLEPGLDHAVPGLALEGPARTEPPANTRAALRGKWIKSLAGRPGCAADWDRLHDDRNRVLLMPQPSGEAARWRRRRTEESILTLLESTSGTGIRAAIQREYDRGNYERVFRLIHHASFRERTRRGPAPPIMPEVLAWTNSRRGCSHLAIASLDELAERRHNADSLAVQYVTVYRYQGLVPHDPVMWGWLTRAATYLAESAASPVTRANLLGHQGAILMRTGSASEAEAVLRAACAIGPLPGGHARIGARNMVDLAEALRLMGRREEAAEWLDRAEAIYRSRRFPGDRADFLITARARLEPDPEAARRLLARARRVQRRFGNQIGLARSLVLDARLATTPATLDRREDQLRSLRCNVPDLMRCPRLKEIVIDRWPLWAGGHAEQDHGDRFWLV